MRILHLTRETGSDVRYGIRKSLIPVLKELTARGHTVELIDQDLVRDLRRSRIARWLESAYINRLRTHYGAPGEAFLHVVKERITVAWAAARLAKGGPPARVHCHDPLIARVFSFFSRLQMVKCRWGYSLHSFGRYVQSREGVILPSRVQTHLQRWENSAARRASWVVAPSSSGLDQMGRDIGMSATMATWHVVPHPRPMLSPAAGAGIRERHGIGDNLLVLAVGQLIPMKRFDLLIEAVSGLPGNNRPHVVILGEGPLEPSLRKMAGERGLGQRFHVAVSDNVTDYLAAADIYVSTSSTEAYGIANCEAMVAGLPSVCCAVGAVPEVMGDGACLTGETVPEIVRALSRLVDSPEERNRLSRRALNRAAQLWSPERVAAALEAIYSRADPLARVSNRPLEPLAP